MTRSAERILDEYLVLCCQEGRSDALACLAERWHGRLLRHATRLLGTDPGVAEEVMQEAWLAILRGIGGLADAALFPAWSYRIVTHKAADWLRREGRRSQVMEALESGDHPPDHPSIPMMVEKAEEEHLLGLALGRLPAANRIVLTLFYLEELGIKEIARVLGTPVGTIKSRLFNSRALLKSLLERKKP